MNRTFKADMGGAHDAASRCFVDATTLDTDETVLDHIHAAYAVRTAKLVQVLEGSQGVGDIHTYAHVDSSTRYTERRCVRVDGAPEATFGANKLDSASHAAQYPYPNISFEQ